MALLNGDLDFFLNEYGQRSFIYLCSRAFFLGIIKLFFRDIWYNSRVETPLHMEIL